MKIREYRAPLTVLSAGALGFSLFIIVSAAALTDPRAPNAAAMEPQNIVDSAISNINTMAALTVESISQYIPTATISASITSTLTQTDLPTNTATSIPTRTRIPPTSTRDHSGSPPTVTPTRLPTQTYTPLPTNTPQPTFTYTPEPTFTNTPEPPPTDTPEPPPTDTPEPTPTDALQLPLTDATAENTDTGP